MIIQFLHPNGNTCHKHLAVLPVKNDIITTNGTTYKVGNHPITWIPNPYPEHQSHPENDDTHLELIPQIRLVNI